MPPVCAIARLLVSTTGTPSERILTVDPEPLRALLSVEPADPAGPPAQAVLRSYIEEMASRYRSRPASRAEVDAALAEHPSEELVPPRGLFCLARRGDAVLGCVALLLVSESVGEVRRLFVVPGPVARGSGAGSWSRWSGTRRRSA